MVLCDFDAGSWDLWDLSRISLAFVGFCAILLILRVILCDLRGLYVILLWFRVHSCQFARFYWYFVRFCVICCHVTAISCDFVWFRMTLYDLVFVEVPRIFVRFSAILSGVAWFRAALFDFVWISCNFMWFGVNLFWFRGIFEWFFVNGYFVVISCDCVRFRLISCLWFCVILLWFRVILCDVVWFYVNAYDFVFVGYSEMWNFKGMWRFCVYFRVWFCGDFAHFCNNFVKFCCDFVELRVISSVILCALFIFCVISCNSVWFRAISWGLRLVLI